MPRFRRRAAADSSPVGDLRPLLDDVFAPRHFFVGPPLQVFWHNAVEEEIPWEIFQGRLLDARQTRQRRALLAWNLVELSEGKPADVPLLSLKLDLPAQAIYVVRGLNCHVWEAVGDGQVIEGRETTRWLPELVGTLLLAEFADAEGLRDELICRLWQAVVGTSRLPLTSLEAPLPEFVLGQLAYVHRPNASTARLTPPQ